MQKSKKKKIEFPDSGKTAWIPAVSLWSMALKLQRRFPRPDPPLNAVDYGDGRTRYEHNFADPDWKRAVEQWESFLEAKSQQEALKRVYASKLSEDQKAEVEAWKEEYPAFWDEHDSDTAIWFENIGIQSDEDFLTLIRALRGNIDEEAVERIQDTFQGNAQGAGHLEGANAS